MMPGMGAGITESPSGYMTMRFDYDAEADALYIRLTDAPVVRSFGDRGVSRVVDYDAEGEIVGVEFLSAERQIGEMLEKIAGEISEEGA
jgi:uncharacterized protein YuzE